MKKIVILMFLYGWCLSAQPQEYNPEEYAVIRSERPDGRLLSSYAIVHDMLKSTQPRYAYQPGMSKAQFEQWQENVRRAMSDIMNFPVIQEQPAPICVSTEEREGYTLEKWEFYPFPKAVSTFLVLKPVNLTDAVPGILCIPGSGGTKEGLAGEPGICDKLTEDYKNPKLTMALNMVKEGYVAVAVDNAAAGEASDLECFGRGWDYDYDVVSRFLLELGWSWLGYTSYLDMQVLNWMKEQTYIRKDRIVVSGFSLGTEPLMVLGTLDKDIYAFIYNDFLCQTQERALVMTWPNDEKRRPFPNSIRHLIPRFWKYFNFPDIVASLAPRPIIFTEGGLDRDFRLVRGAYRDSGYPDNVEFHHYPKYADQKNRIDVEYLPEGIDAKTYFELVNVDPPCHYFKSELVIPWLHKIFMDGMTRSPFSSTSRLITCNESGKDEKKGIRNYEVDLQIMNQWVENTNSFSQGVSALFSGVSDGYLLVAGGANFPDLSVVQGGEKRYYKEVYATSLNDTALSWRKVGDLPTPLAYGFSASTSRGIVCVGGMNDDGAVKRVFRLSMVNGKLKTEELPSLPFALDNMSGCFVDNSLFVLGGNRDGKASNVFLRLDLEHLSTGWVELAPFPGKPRIQPVCAVQKDEKGEYAIYLWGGFAPASSEREASLSTDGYRYSLSQKEWVPLVSPTNTRGEAVSLGGGAAVSVGDSLILCMGGVNKDVFLQALRQPAPDYLSHPAEWYKFNQELLGYHVFSHEWKTVCTSPVLARAGAVAVPYKNMVFYINGEIKPGVRTPTVVRISFSNP